MFKTSFTSKGTGVGHGTPSYKVYSCALNNGLPGGTIESGIQFPINQDALLMIFSLLNGHTYYSVVLVCKKHPVTISLLKATHELTILCSRTNIHHLIPHRPTAC